MFYKDICPFVQKQRVIISAGLKHDVIREKHETHGVPKTYGARLHFTLSSS